MSLRLGFEVIYPDPSKSNIAALHCSEKTKSRYSNRSAIGVFRLGDNGALTEPLETIYPNITTTGPVTLRQDLSYLHHVIVDPTREYLLMADLGGDRIRVFRYNEQNIAPLQELASLVTNPGTGPRHAVFWRSPETGLLYLFFNGELDQKIYSYRVDYTEEGLSWSEPFSIVSVSDSLPAETAPTSEIAITVRLPATQLVGSTNAHVCQ